ncbi:MAG: hypothetical protein V2A72_03130 [Candidatus Omnitrophota bacterium]
MIEINLLPEELRKNKKPKKEVLNLKSANLPWKAIAITIAVVFIASQLLAAQILFFKKGTLKKTELLIKDTEPKYKMAQSLKSEIKQLNSKLSAVNELTSKSILWSKKMSDLSSAVIEGVWLKELSLQQKKGVKTQEVLLLIGSVASRSPGEEAAIIANFINSLRSNGGFYDDFIDIKLESSQMTKIGVLDVMNFKIVCYFKEGRGSFFESKK